MTLSVPIIPSPFLIWIFMFASPGAAVTVRDCRSGHGCPEPVAWVLAPCLLGSDGRGAQNPVLMALQLGRSRYSSARHSIPVTRVFKKVPLSSGS